MEPENNNGHLRDEKGGIQSHDPLFSYVVIEHRLGSAGDTDFLKVEEALSRCRLKIVGREWVNDPSTGQERLRIKLKHQETEEIMMAILASGLKEDYRCYVY